MKPISGGTAAIDAAATAAAPATSGSRFATPDSLRMSRVPVERSTMPTTRNRAALNSAWEMIMATPAIIAERVPSPHMAIRKPSWLTVPYASSSLMSYCRRARQAPMIIVIAPRVSTTGRQPGRSAKTGASRATR